MSRQQQQGKPQEASADSRTSIEDLSEDQFHDLIKIHETMWRDPTPEDVVVGKGRHIPISLRRNSAQSFRQAPFLHFFLRTQNMAKASPNTERVHKGARITWIFNSVGGPYVGQILEEAGKIVVTNLSNGMALFRRDSTK